MRTQASNHNITVNSAANNSSDLDIYLQNGRRLHDQEIGRLICQFAAKVGEALSLIHI